MKALLLLIVSGATAFTGSFLFFRSAQEAAPSGPARPRTASSDHRSKGDRPESAIRSSTGPDLPVRDGATTTLLVPPQLVESLDISALDPFSGEFTADFKELLGLNDQELVATKEAYDTYFRAFSEMELTLATVVSTEERAGDRPGEERLRRFATVRIEPAGDRLAGELQGMRERLVAQLGKPRGLAATSIISHQLGNNGKGGEVVGFARYLGEEKYRIDITGVGDHRLSAGQFVSGPIYDNPSFADFARYRHLEKLIQR